MLRKVWRVLSAVLFIYFVIIEITTGINQIFNYFWLIAALVFCGVSLTDGGRFKALSVFLCICMILTGIAEIPIIRASMTQPDRNAEYVVILGAKVNGKEPSRILSERLNAGLSYYLANEGCRIVVTGGRGSDEDVSEAECMKNWLISEGVPDRNIILEDRAENTWQNLEYTAQLIGKDWKTVIVTSDFHMCRALYLAEKLGFSTVSGKSSVTSPIYIPNFYLREIPAFVKALLIYS